MRLRLPSDQQELLCRALRRAGNKEIGGQIFGEQLAPSDFQATHLTFQKGPGRFARFIVDIVQAARDALRFFDRTGHCYTRFNYIGEWHSHPNFGIRPSGTDLATMQHLVLDHDFQGDFAVLMLARLEGEQLACRAWVFDQTGREQVVTLKMQS